MRAKRLLCILDPSQPYGRNISERESWLLVDSRKKILFYFLLIAACCLILLFPFAVEILYSVISSIEEIINSSIHIVLQLNWFPCVLLFIACYVSNCLTSGWSQCSFEKKCLCMFTINEVKQIYSHWVIIRIWVAFEATITNDFKEALSFLNYPRSTM